MIVIQEIVDARFWRQGQRASGFRQAVADIWSTTNQGHFSRDGFKSVTLHDGMWRTKIAEHPDIDVTSLRFGYQNPNYRDRMILVSNDKYFDVRIQS